MTNQATYRSPLHIVIAMIVVLCAASVGVWAQTLNSGTIIRNDLNGRVTITNTATQANGSSYTIVYPDYVGASGSIMYVNKAAGAVDTVRFLPIGTTNQLLSVDAGGALTWVSPSAASWLLAGNATTTAWNGTTGSFLGTTSAQPLSIATTNATAQDIVMYTGANGANERLRITGAGAITQTGTGQVTFTGNVDATNGLDVTTANLTVGGTNFTVAPATGNTAIAGTLDVTGATTLSSTLNQAGNAVLASTAGSSTTIGNATGAITLSGTALTPNVTVTNLGGTAKTTIGGGFDRIVLANNTGLLEEASINTVIGSSAWALAGNATTTAWNGTTGSFLGTTSAQPLSIATTNATAQDIVMYTGANGANERLRITGTGAITQTGTGQVTFTGNVDATNGLDVTTANLTVGGTNFTVAPATGNTAIAGTLDVTGATTLSSTLNQAGNAVLASTAGSSTTIGNATGAITLSGTALTPNVTVTNLGGTAKTTIGGGFDRIVLANNTGLLEEASINTVIGSSAWALSGNATTTAWNGTTGSFLGTTSAQPLSIATTNATAQDIVMYTGANGANERLRITGAGAITQTGTGAVTLTGATTISNTLSQTGNAVLASTAGSSTTIGNATGAITLSGTALTPNVTVTNLGGTAKTTIGGGFDRIVLANNTGLLEEASINTVIGSSAWALSGNATTTAWNGTTGSFLGTTSAQPLSIATTNATAQDIVMYTGANGANERLRITGAGAITQTGTGAVTLTGATTISNTLSQTGNAVLASTAGSTTTIGNATGAITLSGTPLTPNVTVTNLGGTAKTTIGGGFDRIVLANNTGLLEEASINTVIGSSAWALLGNATTTAWNGTTGSFLGTTSAQPLSIATTNATAQDIVFYSGANGATERLRIAGTTGAITQTGTGAVTLTGATTISNTLSQTGNAVLASTAGSTTTIGNATGAITLSGTALTPNVTVTNLGGTAKTTIGGGFDRIVLANNTGLLEEASINTVIGSSAWLLAGNSGATATNFVGPTTNSIPLNLATSAATPGNIDFYIGTVLAANRRMQLTNTTLTIGTGAANVATTITGNTSVTGTFGVTGASTLTGTLNQTGNAVLASTAGSTTTIGNATGAITLSGTALTPNVTVTNLGGTAKTTIGGGFDRIVLANNTGLLEEASINTVIGSSAWALAGNATTTAWNGTTGSFLGTTSAQPLSIATTNATAQDIVFYSGANGATERLRIAGTTGAITQTGTGAVTLTGATTISNTLSQTGNAVLASTAGSTTTIGNATGAITLSGTALTPNVTVTNLGGTAKTSVPGGFDRIVVANNTGLLDEVAMSTLLGSAAWALAGNATTTAWNGTTGSFLGTTSAQPLSIATTNATAQDIVFYSGANGATERLRIAGTTGAITQTGTGAVTLTGATTISNTLSQTGNAVLASTAGSTTTIGNATGAITLSGTALTPNVTVTNLGGTAKTSITAGYDRIIIANNTGSLDEATFATVIGNTAWLTTGNSGTTAGTNYIGTNDNQAFEIHVNEAGTATEGRRRVLRIEPNAASANIIAGYSGNGLGLGTTAVGVTIAGGGLNTQVNRASDNYNTISGGAFNRAGSNDATTNNAEYATIAGGFNNVASGQYSFVGGGQSNTASTNGAASLGGTNNNASGTNASIVGGSGNVASGTTSFVGGGASNSNAGISSSILGGTGNSLTAGGDYTTILGGRGLTFGTSAGSLGFVGNNPSGANNFVVSQNNTAFLGNVNLWLANNDGTARQLRFYEPQATNGAFPAVGTQYTAFQAAASITTDHVYTFPAATGTAGQVLRIASSPAPTTSAATLEWVDAGTSGWLLSGNPTTDAWNGTTGSRLGTTSTQSLVIANTNATAQDILVYGGNSGATKRMEIDGSTGNVGIGDITPGTKLDVDGGFTIRPAATVAVTANNQTVNPGNRSYLVLDGGGANRNGLILGDGSQAGQILIIRILETAANRITLPDNAATNNTDLTGDWDGRANDTITLIWTGVDWVETARSNN